MRTAVQVYMCRHIYFHKQTDTNMHINYAYLCMYVCMHVCIYVYMYMQTFTLIVIVDTSDYAKRCRCVCGRVRK